MLAYSLAFAWGIVVTLSLVGWGSAIRLLLFRERASDWGLSAACGLAFSVVIGGVFDLVSLISPATVYAFLALGVGAWILLAVLPWRERRISNFISAVRTLPLGTRTLAAFVIGLLALSYAAGVSLSWKDGGPNIAPNFQPLDDFQAYLVFPKKMLQTGSIGLEPFSGRRLEGSLGGHAFLDTFVLAALPVRNVHILERGVGLLITVALLWGMSVRRRASPSIALAVVAFLLLLPVRLGNLSSLFTGLALFLALFSVLDSLARAPTANRANAVIVALLAAALCALKSTLIPVCGLFLAGSYASYLVAWRFATDAIVETLIVGVLVPILLLPWMISMHRSSGTLLYPLLGRGFHQSVYGNAIMPYAGTTPLSATVVLVKGMSDPIGVALLALLVFHLINRPRQIQRREALLSLLIAALVGKAILLLLTPGVSSDRYMWPFVMAALLAALVEFIGPTEASIRTASNSSRWLALASAVFVLGATWNESVYRIVTNARAVRAGVQPDGPATADEVQRYTNLQASLPAGATVLTRLDKPFLLDFKRNVILIDDEPGEASPPPGMPYFKGSEPLAAYLAAQSIRYVAYSYYPRPYLIQFSAPDAPPWLRNIAQHTLDFQDNLVALSTTRRHIFDDGTIVVLDLNTRDATASGPKNSR